MESLAEAGRVLPEQRLRKGRNQRVGGVTQRKVTGDKARRVSPAGDERLRQLLVLEATAIIQYTKPGRPATSRVFPE